MQKMGLNTIRQKFLDFFEVNNHLVQPSYPLVPLTDKTLLLISAGMVPLKDYFTGVSTPPSTRMATCQKCIRTNDIESVGHTSRHASFFEMLGNFSFGDYFKEEAIRLSWSFITKDLAIDPDKLWVTVYLEDDEAHQIWHEQEGVPLDRIVRLGKADNFWEIGTGTGPCGPCSEIYFDRGEKFGCGDPNCQPGCDCDRFVEFWNLVFTQYEKDEHGELHALANPNIDTGMGLERVACLMQDVDSIFDVDTIKQIRDAVVKKTDKTYGLTPKDDASVRIITDHIRAVTFLVTDGVMPNNEGRGYVLRRLLRRAARHGRLLGIQGAFLFELVDTVIEVSGQAYPELIERQAYTKKIIAIEEERFEQTIDQGLNILNGYIDTLHQSNETVLSGELAFKLYDTYGFPLDLTLEILTEKSLKVDREAFEYEMNEQRKRARSSRDSGSMGWSGDTSDLVKGFETTFTGYHTLESDAEVLAIIQDGELVLEAFEESQVLVVLDQTPFYAESGGQVADKGTLTAEDFVALVNDTQKSKSGVPIHHVQVMNGTLKVGQVLVAKVTQEERMDIARNHTATHLLHQALKDVLGDHVEQAGSMVHKNRLRFDFTHFQGLTFEELSRVEAIVNEKIFNALPVTVEEMGIEEAKEKGAMALFGEKYGDDVRVVSIGDYSIELCGGTHLKSAAEIGMMKIISETGVAAGMRRIEAVTGRGYYERANQIEMILDEAIVTLKTKQSDFLSRLHALVEDHKHLSKEVSSLKQANANASLSEIEKTVKHIKNIRLIDAVMHDADMDVVRNLADQLAENQEATLIVLASVGDDKVNFIAKANDLAVQSGVHCGNIIKELAKTCGGGGGGRPNMAQAGGKDVSKVQEAMAKLPDLI